MNMCYLTVFLLLSQTHWVKYAGNPVLEKSNLIYEFYSIGQPTVILEEDTFKIFYSGADVDGKARIIYALSTDGVNWTKHFPPIIEPGDSDSWDSRWLDTPDIIRDSMGYKLYFYGDSSDQLHSAIGVAFSEDGINWQKYANNPVLQKGVSGEWDEGWIESPTVIYNADSGYYEMWFTGTRWNPESPMNWEINIGYATSPDGVEWTKYPQNPVLRVGDSGTWDDGWVSVPTVIKRDSFYEMWYSAVSISDWAANDTIDTIKIGYAVSTDEIHWTKYSHNPVFLSTDVPIDIEGPWAPDVLFNNNTFFMWYEAAESNGGANFICFATAPLDWVSENNGNALYNLVVYPNPFTEKLHIDWLISGFQAGMVEIYDAAGRKVRSLTVAGRSFVWNGLDNAGKSVSPGVYFLRVKTDRASYLLRILRLK